MAEGGRHHGQPKNEAGGEEAETPPPPPSPFSEMLDAAQLGKPTSGCLKQSQ